MGLVLLTQSGHKQRKGSASPPPKSRLASGAEGAGQRLAAPAKAGPAASPAKQASPLCAASSPLFITALLIPVKAVALNHRAAKSDVA